MIVMVPGCTEQNGTTVSESDVHGADQQTGMNPIPASEQKRILRLMLNEDLIWEVAGKSYRTIYNDKLGRQQRIPASLVEAMEQQGWIRRLPNPDATRLDGWELTVEGRALAARLKTTRRAK
jgi:hypothetical protein